RPPGCALISATTFSHASSLREDTTTFAPCSARRIADARPMPREEPVTTATRPLRSNRDIAAPSECRPTAGCRVIYCTAAMPARDAGAPAHAQSARVVEEGRDFRDPSRRTRGHSVGYPVCDLHDRTCLRGRRGPGVAGARPGRCEAHCRRGGGVYLRRRV